MWHWQVVLDEFSLFGVRLVASSRFPPWQQHAESDLPDRSPCVQRSKSTGHPRTVAIHFIEKTRPPVMTQVIRQVGVVEEAVTGTWFLSAHVKRRSVVPNQSSPKRVCLL